MKKIPPPNETCYLGFLESAPNSSVEATHLAMVRIGDKTVRAYVKLYRENSRGLINEITYHLLASALGLPIADPSAVIMVPVKSLRIRPKWIPANVSTWPAWCSRDMAAPDIKVLLGNNPGAWLHMREELALAAITPVIVAMDDWLANTDRNLGNLLRLAIGQYVLIDHGWCITGPHWSGAILDPDGVFENKLRKLLGTAVEQLPFRNGMKEQGDRFGSALQQMTQELIFWWKLLLSEADQKAILDFLERRASPDAATRRAGVLL